MVYSAFIRCDICDKSFSGPEPFQDHLNSKKHKNKAGLATGSDGTSTEDSLRCELCDMKFSGPVPYAQHIEGSRHKSHIKKKEIVDELAGTDKSGVASSRMYPVLPTEEPNSPVGAAMSTVTAVVVDKCELCGVCVTGPESLKDHLESKGHKRKMDLSGLKQVLGHNSPPASAPNIDESNEKAAEDDATVVATNQASEKKQPKKQMGCFSFLCTRSKKKGHEKENKTSVLSY